VGRNNFPFSDVRLTGSGVGQQFPAKRIELKTGAFNFIETPMLPRIEAMTPCVHQLRCEPDIGCATLIAKAVAPIPGTLQQVLARVQPF
jgi:hypothetical protein